MIEKIIKMVLVKSKNIALFILEEMFFYVPIIVIISVGYQYIGLSFDIKYSHEQYKIIIGAIGITATLSSLSFRASSSSEDRKKKIIYYNQGQKLFHATILFIIAVSIKYICHEISPAIFSGNYYLVKIFRLFSLMFGTIFFYIGLSYMASSLMALNKLLFEEKLLP